MNESANPDKKIESLLVGKTENLKELACINQVNSLIAMGKPIRETIERIAQEIPGALNHPESKAVCISYNNAKFKSSEFEVTNSFLSTEFKTIDDLKGEIRVYNLRKIVNNKSDSFLPEEKRFIEAIVGLIVEFLNGRKALQIIETSNEKGEEEDSLDADSVHITTQQLLQKFLDRHNSERNLFHELMPFKVK